MLEDIPEFGLLTRDEQAIAERVATECMAAASERDRQRTTPRDPLCVTSRYENLRKLAPMTLEQLESLPDYPEMTMTERAALLMTPFEEVSEKRRESLRLLDALQSLPSKLYWAKKEKLGIEEYLRQHQTTRVR